MSTIQGLPCFNLLPAAKYNLNIIKEGLCITIPKSGRFTLLDPEYPYDTNDEFNCIEEVEGVEAIKTATITDVLFATNQYPALEKNQLFAVSAIAIGVDNITIVGSIIEFVPTGEDDA